MNRSSASILRRAALLFACAVAALGPLLCGGSARASTNTCLGQPDGTPCNTDCTTGGVCKKQVCINGVNAPNGTACATGNLCTVGDNCQAGVCVAGGPLDCMPGPCQSATCNPNKGCQYKPIACDMSVPPDLTTVDLAPPPDLTSAPVDLATPPADLATPPDLAMTPPDLATAGDLATMSGDLSTALDAAPPDLATADAIPPVDATAQDAALADLGPLDDGGDAGPACTSISHPCEGGVFIDGTFYPPDAPRNDAGEPVDDMNVPLGHVHGSGCNCSTTGGAPVDSLLIALALLAPTLRRRRRA